ncbi:MAG: HDOD domain-containing protein [Fidelibacterota bacterium]
MPLKLEELINEVNNSNFASIRGIITGIFDIINNSRSSVNDLEAIIKLDPPLASRVLKVANSAFYASRVEFKDLKEAVLWIGFDEIRNIAITQQLYKVFMRNNYNSFSRKDLWKNSIATALLAKMIFRREFGEKGENLYTAGLIHNIGIIIIDQFLNDEFHDILEYAEENEADQWIAENKFLNYDHTTIAYELGKAWNFPEELRETVKHHHNPGEAAKDFQKNAATIFIADYYCKKWGLGYCDINNPDTEMINLLLQNNKIEHESLVLMRADLIEQIVHFENIGLLSNGK